MSNKWQQQMLVSNDRMEFNIPEIYEQFSFNLEEPTGSNVANEFLFLFIW